MTGRTSRGDSGEQGATQPAPAAPPATAPRAAAPAPAAEPAAFRYQLGFLRRGLRAGEHTPEQLQEIQKGHLANIGTSAEVVAAHRAHFDRLRAEGKVLAHGPIEGPGTGDAAVTANGSRRRRGRHVAGQTHGLEREDDVPGDVDLVSRAAEPVALRFGGRR